jgi:hypothetical protein
VLTIGSDWIIAARNIPSISGLANRPAHNPILDQPGPIDDDDHSHDLDPNTWLTPYHLSSAAMPSDCDLIRITPETTGHPLEEPQAGLDIVQA